MEVIRKGKNWHVAELELVYRSTVKQSQLMKVTSSEASYTAFMECWDEGKIQYIEQAKMLILNRANRILGIHELSTGGVSSTIIDPKIVFSAALLVNGSGIIVAHNHPSGRLIPSNQDKALTSNLVQAGKMLEIDVLDHLIISDEGYFSFADEGLI